MNSDATMDLVRLVLGGLYGVAHQATHPRCLPSRCAREGAEFVARLDRELREHQDKEQGNG